MGNEGIQRPIGDRITAMFDGHLITLQTTRKGRDHVIALTPEALANLIEFVADMKREFDI